MGPMRRFLSNCFDLLFIVVVVLQTMQVENFMEMLKEDVNLWVWLKIIYGITETGNQNIIA